MRRNSSSVLIFIILIFLFSCKKDEIELIKDTNGIIIRKQPLWQIKLSEGGYNSSMFDPVVYSNNVIMGCFKNNKPGMAAIDINTGKKNWENYPFRFGSFMPSFLYLYEGKMITSNGRVEIFDLNNGNKIWENLNGNSNIGRLYGIDNLIFTNEKENNSLSPYWIETSWVYDIISKTGEKFYTPDLGDIPSSFDIGSIVGGVEFQVPYKNEKNEILVFIFTTSVVKYLSGEDFVCLYNYTKKEWIYKDVPMKGSPLNSGLSGYSAIIYNNKIYFSGVPGIECYDLQTGKQDWVYTVNQVAGGTSTGGFIITENKLIGIEGDSDKKIFALDLKTGNRIWATPSSAGQLTSTMQLLNDIVYFTSMTDGKLHAVNVETGKYVWLMDSPDLKIDDGSHFQPNCTVLPGENGKKGKVFVSSYLYGYCYEAEQ